MKKNISLFLIIFSLFIVFGNVSFAIAGCSEKTSETDCSAQIGCSWIEGVDDKPGTCKDNNCNTSIGITNVGIDLLSDPTGRSCPDLSEAAGDDTLSQKMGGKVNVIVKVILGFSATIGLIAFVYAGVVILISKGDPKSFQSGINIIKYTFIGIIIIIFSYAIVSFLTTTIPTIIGSSK